MSVRVKRRGAYAALLVLILAGLSTLYQACFGVWMTAYPFANASEWHPRILIQLATLVVIGLFCSGIVVWLFRTRHRR